MSKELNGKVALVTGGSRGIGAAIAKALADDGADVAISYATSADKADAVVKELRKKGVRAEAFRADQANTKEVEGLVEAVVKRFGRLDILVNNAGVFASAPCMTAPTISPSSSGCSPSMSAAWRLRYAPPPH